MIANEVTLETYPIIFGYLCLVPIFQIQLLRRANYNLKLWFEGMMRMNSINYLIFGNYVLCRSILPKFGEYLRDSFGFYLAKNLMSLTNFIYFAFFTILFQKCIYLYYDFLKLLKITDPKTIIIVIRFCLTFAVGVPVSSVINMEFEDWGSWLMLFSYTHFLFSFYTRMNVYVYLMKKILLIMFPRMQYLFEEKNSENYSECMERISGCLLDLIFIVNQD